MSEKKNLEKWRLMEELYAPAREKIFFADVIVYEYLWQADVEMRPYTRFKRLPLHSHHYRHVE